MLSDDAIDFWLIRKDKNIFSSDLLRKPLRQVGFPFVTYMKLDSAGFILI